MFLLSFELATSYLSSIYKAGCKYPFAFTVFITIVIPKSSKKAAMGNLQCNKNRSIKTNTNIGAIKITRIRLKPKAHVEQGWCLLSLHQLPPA